MWVLPANLAPHWLFWVRAEPHFPHLERFPTASDNNFSYNSFRNVISICNSWFFIWCCGTYTSLFEHFLAVFSTKEYLSQIPGPVTLNCNLPGVPLPSLWGGVETYLGWGPFHTKCKDLLSGLYPKICFSFVQSQLANTMPVDPSVLKSPWSFSQGCWVLSHCPNAWSLT